MMPDPDGKHRCPECGVVVVDVHECTEQWEEPDYGIKGSETTRCEVKGDLMFVSVSGGTDMSGAGAILAMGGDAANEWFAGLDREDDS